MVAKVNGAIAPGSFIGHDIEHWNVTGVNMTTPALASALVQVIELKATITELGILQAAGIPTAFSIETPQGWGATAVASKAALEAACDAVFAIQLAVFTTVTY